MPYRWKKFPTWRSRPDKFSNQRFVFGPTAPAERMRPCSLALPDGLAPTNNRAVGMQSEPAIRGAFLARRGTVNDLTPVFRI